MKILEKLKSLFKKEDKTAFIDEFGDKLFNQKVLGYLDHIPNERSYTTNPCMEIPLRSSLPGAHIQKELTELQEQLKEKVLTASTVVGDATAKQKLIDKWTKVIDDMGIKRNDDFSSIFVQPDIISDPANNIIFDSGFDEKSGYYVIENNEYFFLEDDEKLYDEKLARYELYKEYLNAKEEQAKLNQETFENEIEEQTGRRSALLSDAYKSKEHLKAGIVNAPYVISESNPTMSPTMSPLKSISSRYATKKINSDFYGVIKNQSEGRYERTKSEGQISGINMQKLLE